MKLSPTTENYDPSFAVKQLRTDPIALSVAHRARVWVAPSWLRGPIAVRLVVEDLLRVLNSE